MRKQEFIYVQVQITGKMLTFQQISSSSSSSSFRVQTSLQSNIVVRTILGVCAGGPLHRGLLEQQIQLLYTIIINS